MEERWGNDRPGLHAPGAVAELAAVARIGVFEHVLVSKFSMPVPKAESAWHIFTAPTS